MTTLRLLKFEKLEMNDKRLKTDLLLIMSTLTKKDIVDIYPIGFSYPLSATLTDHRADQ